MILWRFSWNAGVVVAGVLLAVGAALLYLPGPDRPELHTAGLGVLILAFVVHLVSRVVMLVKERRR